MEWNTVERATNKTASVTAIIECFCYPLHKTVHCWPAWWTHAFHTQPHETETNNRVDHDTDRIQHNTWGGLGLSPGRMAGETEGDTDDLDSICCWFLQSEDHNIEQSVTWSGPWNCTFCPALTPKCSSPSWTVSSQLSAQPVKNNNKKNSVSHTVEQLSVKGAHNQSKENTDPTE